MTRGLTLLRRAARFAAAAVAAILLAFIAADRMSGAIVAMQSREVVGFACMLLSVGGMLLACRAGCELRGALLSLGSLVALVSIIHFEIWIGPIALALPGLLFLAYALASRRQQSGPSR